MELEFDCIIDNGETISTAVLINNPLTNPPLRMQSSNSEESKFQQVISITKDLSLNTLEPTFKSQVRDILLEHGMRTCSISYNSTIQGERRFLNAPGKFELDIYGDSVFNAQTIFKNSRLSYVVLKTPLDNFIKTCVLGLIAMSPDFLCEKFEELIRIGGRAGKFLTKKKPIPEEASGEILTLQKKVSRHTYIFSKQKKKENIINFFYIFSQVLTINSISYNKE